MKKFKAYRRVLTVFLVVLCSVLIIGFTLARYASEWDHLFGLLISPTEQIDHSLHRYFKSNELLPKSQSATYTVNGTSGWFTVSNALDSSTVSQDDIKYDLTWYYSSDGTVWKKYENQEKNVKGAIFAKDVYGVTTYTVEPITVEGVVYNYVKVVGNTSSFLQEDLEAVYTFVYSEPIITVTHSGGVITVKINTNDMSGEYEFEWKAGIVPDNSDPHLVFTDAAAGPSSKKVTLEKHTVYEFLFFVTGGSFDADSVTVTKQ